MHWDYIHIGTPGKQKRESKRKELLILKYFRFGNKSVFIFPDSGGVITAMLKKMKSKCYKHRSLPAI